jgi:hypothetical protein
LRPWRADGARAEDQRVTLSLEFPFMYSVAALLFVGVLLVALGLFVAGNMVIVGVGIVALLGAGAFETLAARRS